MAVERYVGLMSGTSADGIDAVLVALEDGRFLGIEQSFHAAHPDSLRHALIALGSSASPQISIAELAALDVLLAEHFAAAALAVIKQAGLSADAIHAIGSHGQTIFHSPKAQRSSVQLGDPNLIAVLCGAPVVADFRRADIALGGQGAPLVPAFHEAVFGNSAIPTVIVNIGGIANVTVLADTENDTVGYDCGPGNALMDQWTVQHLGTTYDAGGQYAASGQIIESLLVDWLADPYFNLPAPKSTGRAQFNLQWAQSRSSAALAALNPADVQATLCELTARTICSTVPSRSRRLLVCGGGAFNDHLMRRLADLLPNAEVASTDRAGLHPQWVEAAAFAWLAHQRVHRLPGNLPSVTGASRLAVLGGLYG